MAPEAASKAAGMSRDYLRVFFERGDQEMKPRTAAKFAHLFGVDVAWLLGVPAGDAPIPREAPVAAARHAVAPLGRIPVRGVAAGAIIGAQTLADDPLDYIERPVGLRDAARAYALWVTGSSMSPKFEPRDVVFVHPDQPYERGDTVIVQTQDAPDGPIKALIKIFDGMTDSSARLRQLNPAGTITIPTRSIRAIHRVPPWREIVDR